jgi:hypothetical protein
MINRPNAHSRARRGAGLEPLRRQAAALGAAQFAGRASRWTLPQRARGGRRYWGLWKHPQRPLTIKMAVLFDHQTPRPRRRLLGGVGWTAAQWQLFLQVRPCLARREWLQGVLTRSGSNGSKVHSAAEDSSAHLVASAWGGAAGLLPGPAAPAPAAAAQARWCARAPAPHGETAPMALQGPDQWLQGTDQWL